MSISQLDVLHAYKNVFSETPGTSGYVVLEDLQRAHYVFGPTIGAQPIDPYTMAYNEGARNVVLRIMSILQSKEEDYDNRDTRQRGLTSKWSTVDINRYVDARYDKRDSNIGPGPDVDVHRCTASASTAGTAGTEF